MFVYYKYTHRKNVLCAVCMLPFSAVPKRHGSAKGISQGDRCLVSHDAGYGSQSVALPPLPPCRPRPACFACVHPFSELQSPVLYMRQALGHAGGHGARGLAYAVTALTCFLCLYGDGNKDTPLTQSSSVIPDTGTSSSARAGWRALRPRAAACGACGHGLWCPVLGARPFSPGA